MRELSNRLLTLSLEYPGLNQFVAMSLKHCFNSTTDVVPLAFPLVKPCKVVCKCLHLATSKAECLVLA